LWHVDQDVAYRLALAAHHHFHSVTVNHVQDLLGHADYYLTTNTYSHVVPELQRDLADRMDSLFASGQ